MEEKLYVLKGFLHGHLRMRYSVKITILKTFVYTVDKYESNYLEL